MNDPKDLERGEFMVTRAVGDRLKFAGEPPGIRTAVTDGVLSRIDSVIARMRSQFEHLRTGSSRRIPDAYYNDEQEAENELQNVAAGFRAAMALGGALGDPFEIERSLAAGLTPTGVWARLGEASRVPRPATRPAVLDWSLQPVPWIEDKDAGWPLASAEAVTAIRQLVGGEAERVRVAESPFTDWVQLGFVEKQRTFGIRYPKSPPRQLMLMSGLEICDGPPPTNSLPFSELPPELWVSPYTDLANGLDADAARAAVAVGRRPLAALVSYEGTPGLPSEDRGLGLHQFCLTPQLEIVALLGLRPESPAIRQVLVDDHGPGIVCRQWRSYLIHAGDYGPLEPAVIGADLIIRPDLFHALEETIGVDRLGLGLTVWHHEGAEPGDDAED